MTFDRTELTKVAKLARLALQDDEIDRLRTDLERIINFVTQLGEVDVQGVAPMSHAGDRALMLRDDVVHDVAGRQNFVSSAGYDEGLVKIPIIIE